MLQKALATLHARQIGTLAQLRVLLAILEGPKPVSRLCESVAIPFSTGSRVVYELYGMGLVRYSDSEKDRRLKVIELTKKGAALLEPFARLEQAVAA